MTTLSDWASDWGIPQQAIADLTRRMTSPKTMASSIDDNSSTEAGVSQRVRLTLAQRGAVVWRNNVGVMADDRGVPVRFGLANESKGMNQIIKSSDLIGVTPVEVTQSMVGHIIGQFTAVETKKPGWSYTNNPREKAQLKFIELVIAKGGIGYFTC